jgi:hypothetical protein
MNNTNDQLKRRIMRRVYAIYAIRLALHPTTLRLAAVLALFWRSTAYISYTNVLANSPSIFDIRGELNFLQAALANTETVTFTMLAAVGVLAIWLAADALRPKTAGL